MTITVSPDASSLHDEEQNKLNTLAGVLRAILPETNLEKDKNDEGTSTCTYGPRMGRSTISLSGPEMPGKASLGGA
jgi:hypothetical protein